MTIGDVDYREYFTQEVIEELKQSFEDIDTTGDGLIGTGELYAKMKGIGKNLKMSQVKELIAEVDVDGNGELDWEEYCLLEIKMRRARPRADLINYHNYLTERTKKQLAQWFALSDMAEEELISMETVKKICMQQEIAELDDYIQEICMEVDKGKTGAMSFPQFCCFWAVITRARHLVNYREYFEAHEVEGYRALFQGAAKTHDDYITCLELGQVLKRLGVSLKERKLKLMFEEFDQDCSGTMDVEEFAVLILKMRGLRKIRDINPDTCSCYDLWWKEKFSIRELMRSGFSLEDFAKVRIPVGKLHREGEFTALELRRAGYSAAELRKGGVGLLELRSCGYTLADLRLAGFSASALLETNRSLQGSISAGDLSILPQIRPRPIKSRWSKDARKNFQTSFLRDSSSSPTGRGLLARLPSTGMMMPEMRQMTPVVREHTDWRRPTSKYCKNVWHSKLPTVGTTIEDDFADSMQEDFPSPAGADAAALE